MGEIRVDPLGGGRVIVGDLAAEPSPPAPRAARQLFQAAAAAGRRRDLPLPAPLEALDRDALAEAMAGWREAMRQDAAHVHLHVPAGEPVARLLAFGFVPAQAARERERFAAYAAANYGANLLQDLVQEEVKLGERLVAVDEEAVLLAAFAPRAPYHLVVVPRRPAARFEDDGPLGAGLVHDALARLARAGAPPCDLLVRTAPRGADPFCWHIDLRPRAEGPHLELGTDVPFVAPAPEAAAAALRES